MTAFFSKRCTFMARWITLFLLTVVVLLLLLFNVVIASADESGIRILASDEKGVLIEVSVPTFSAPATGDKASSSSLEIAGYDAAGNSGQPALPQKSLLIGVPPDAQVRLELLQADDPVTQSMYVLPIPTQRVREWNPDGISPDEVPTFDVEYVEDPSIYAVDSFYPSDLVSISSDGYLRDQRYVQIAVRPVQYNPVREEVRQYQSLKFRVVFEYPASVTSQGKPRAESQAFETILDQSILNYDAARAWRTPSLATESIEASTADSPAYRVSIGETGVYQITYGELQTAGLPVTTLDPRTFKLSNQGSEVAIYVSGEDDGQFDTGDYILFYGVGVNTLYTNVNVYWLTYGDTNGLRMAERDGTPGGASVPTSFANSWHQEEDHSFMSYLPMQEGADHWYWDYVSAVDGNPAEKVFPVDLGYLSGDAYTARLSVFLTGGTVNPDHHVEFLVNGVSVGDTEWDGLTVHLAEFDFPQSSLIDGSNQVTIRLLNDTGQLEDRVWLNWFEIEYLDVFRAEGNQLPFTIDSAGSWEYHITDFSDPDVTILDVSDPANPTRIVGASVSGTPSYELAFQDTIGAEAVDYIALAAPALESAHSIELDSPSDLHSVSNGADYLVITHGDFYESMSPLVDHRSSQGMRTVLVDVQDVYDEFSYGLSDPEAIHDFLAYAYANWQPPAPTYVLLVGDGTFDPKDNKETGDPTFIPPYLALVDPELGVTAADNRYAMVSGDDILPDVLIGRLPVNSVAEADAVVQKILTYEQSLPEGDWRQQLLFVADNADRAGDFANLSDAVSDDFVAPPYQATKVYLEVTCDYENPSVACKQEVLAGINAGSLIVNFVGHSAIQNWAGEKLLSVTDLAGLTNGDKLPILLPMTCYEGAFHYPGIPALGESVVRVAGKGAVASWSPSGLGVARGHDSLDKGFFDAIFVQGVRDLGSATMAGKLRLFATGKDLDLVDTYHLFGDPALHVPILDPGLHIQKTVEPQGVVGPGDVVTYTLTFSNTGPASALGVVVTDVFPLQLVNPTVVFTSPEVLSQRPGATYAWDVADLAPGDRGEVVVRATISPDTEPGVIENEAEIVSGSFRDVASVTIGVDMADLSVVKTGPETAWRDQQITYTLSYANIGLATAENVSLTDSLPSDLVYQSDNSGLDRTEPTPGTFVWQVGDLAPGEGGSFELVVQVSHEAPVGVVLTNTLTIQSDAVDPDHDNDQSLWHTTIAMPRIYLPVVFVNSP